MKKVALSVVVALGLSGCASYAWDDVRANGPLEVHHSDKGVHELATCIDNRWMNRMTSSIRERGGGAKLVMAELQGMTVAAAEVFPEGDGSKVDFYFPNPFQPKVFKEGLLACI